jgi:hypothetical protein
MVGDYDRILLSATGDVDHRDAGPRGVPRGQGARQRENLDLVARDARVHSRPPTRLRDAARPESRQGLSAGISDGFARMSRRCEKKFSKAKNRQIGSRTSRRVLPPTSKAELAWSAAACRSSIRLEAPP